MSFQKQGRVRPDGRRKLAMIAAAAILVAAAAAGGYWMLSRTSRAQARKAATATTATRLVKVWSGSVERTIRLTGTTAPERFSALLAPQLRGSRHGPHSTVSTQPSSSGSTASSSSGASTSSASASSTSSGQTTTAAAGQNGTTAPTGTVGVSGSGAGALPTTGSLATALNRFSTPTSGTTQRRSSPSAAPVSSSEDLGSTSSSLLSIGTGGGGGDWDLILQKVVPPGSRVRKGQVIAEFDRQYQLLRLDDYKANLDQQQEALKALKANLDVDKKAHLQSIETAKSNLEKAKYDLKTIPVQSAIVAEQLRLAAEEAEAQYRELSKEVKYKDIVQAADYRQNSLEVGESKIELSRAQVNADRLLIKSPIDGITVMSSTFRGGEFGQIQAGDELHPGQMFMRVVDPSSMVINATVNQADIEMLRIGQKARVRFDAYPNLELPARIHAIAAMPKTGGFRAAWVKEVPVVLKLDQLDPRVIPDLSVSVDVMLSAEDNAAVAPLEGVFFDGGKPCVFVAGGAGNFERREVELGLANNVIAAVRSGLNAGEVIAAERPKQEKR